MFWFVDSVPFGLAFEILCLSAGDCRSDEPRKPSLFQELFVAGGDAATVTRNDLPERLKGMGYSVNFKADA